MLVVHTVGLCTLATWWKTQWHCHFVAFRIIMITTSNYNHRWDQRRFVLHYVTWFEVCFWKAKEYTQSASPEKSVQMLVIGGLRLLDYYNQMQGYIEWILECPMHSMIDRLLCIINNLFLYLPNKSCQEHGIILITSTVLEMIIANVIHQKYKVRPCYIQIKACEVLARFSVQLQHSMHSCNVYHQTQHL